MNAQTSRLSWLRQSVVFKLAVIGFLALGLLIPIAMIDDLVAERQGRQEEVERKIGSSWGAAQTLGGPVISVPYERHWSREDTDLREFEGRAYFLPETLTVEGRLEPEVRNLGIFEVVVYRARLRLSGTFSPPRAAGLQLPPGKVRWDEADLVVGIPDLRGVRQGVELLWGGEALPVRSGTGGDELFQSGLHVPIANLGALSPGADPIHFELELELNGTGKLEVVPVGGQTEVRLASSWPDPAFVGSFLPAERRVGSEGFEASWRVSHLGRGFPSAWRSEENLQRQITNPFHGSAFGVDLVQVVDAYLQTERSLKYALLFVVMAFTTFFLFEVFQPFSLHGLQYLLVGFALSMFYVLLLSISEHLSFGVAYSIATAATAALIGAYSGSILRGRLRGLAMAGVLGALYGYLYVLLQVADYALLLGSVGLFAILAAVMLLTRRVDWHSMRLGRSEPVAEEAGA